MNGINIRLRTRDNCNAKLRKLTNTNRLDSNTNLEKKKITQLIGVFPSNDCIKITRKVHN